MSAFLLHFAAGGPLPQARDREARKQLKQAKTKKHAVQQVGALWQPFGTGLCCAVLYRLGGTARCRCAPGKAAWRNNFMHCTAQAARASTQPPFHRFDWWWMPRCSTVGTAGAAPLASAC